MEKLRIRVGSVGWLIERYLREMNGLDTGKAVRPIGTSHLYSLKLLQRSPIGAVMARDLTKHHVIEHCRKRRETVCAATVMQDVTYLSGVLKYAPSAWNDSDEVSDAAVAGAKPFLVKNGLIGKSTPRKRVPTKDEEAQLIAYFEQPPKKRTSKFIYAMPDIIRFALKSTRRISEICRIDRAIDVKLDHVGEDGQPAPLYRVRAMKDPKRRDKEKWFPLLPELAEILFRQPVKEGDSRFFPFDCKSVGAKYTRAKKVLGIADLHFHDNRREGATRRLKTMTPNQVRHFFTGHETTVMLERVYDATNPADAHALLREGAAA